jgi:hypothetical protein
MNTRNNKKNRNGKHMQATNPKQQYNNQSGNKRKEHKEKEE